MQLDPGALPTLDFDVAMHGSSTLTSSLEPVTVAVMIIVAILPTALESEQ